MSRTKEQDVARHKIYYKTHKKQEVARAIAWNKANPEKKAISQRKSLYGLDKAGTDRLYESQGGLCALCSIPLNGDFHIDHCHTSGRVRGLLCRNCNLMLGRAHDSIEMLQRAITYLSQI